MPATPISESPFRATVRPHIPLKFEKEPDHFKVAKIVFPILFSLGGFLVLAIDVAFTLTAIVSFGALLHYHRKENDSSSRTSDPFSGAKTPSKSMSTNYLAMADGSPLPKGVVAKLRKQCPGVQFCPVPMDKYGIPQDVLEASNPAPLTPATLEKIKTAFPKISVSPFTPSIDGKARTSTAQYFKGGPKSTPIDLSPIVEDSCARTLLYTPATPQSTLSDGSPMTLCGPNSSHRGKIIVPQVGSQTPSKKNVSFESAPGIESPSEEVDEIMTPRKAKEVVYYLKEKFGLSPFKSILKNKTPMKLKPSSANDRSSTPDLSPFATPLGKNVTNKAGSTPHTNRDVHASSAPPKSNKRFLRKKFQSLIDSSD